MPLPVRERFGLMTALRVLAFLDSGRTPVRSGYPVTAPVLSLQPAGESALVGATGLATDLLELLARARRWLPTCSHSTSSLSRQRAGGWVAVACWAPLGAMSVTAVYAGGPPIPGRQVA